MPLDDQMPGRMPQSATLPDTTSCARDAMPLGDVEAQEPGSVETKRLLAKSSRVSAVRALHCAGSGPVRELPLRLRSASSDRADQD